MKTTVVLARHGQSVGNLYHLFLGHTDLPLTELGEKQAECLAAYLDKYRFDAIYASDLSRAMGTAEPTARRQGREIIREKGMREIYAAEWEQRSFEEIAERYKKAYRVWMTDIGMACPTGGESVLELAARVYRTFDRIVEENAGKTVLIATHATPIRLLKCRFLARSPEMAGTVKWAPNASVTVVEVEDGRYRIIEDGVDSYLAGLASAFPANI